MSALRALFSDSASAQALLERGLFRYGFPAHVMAETIGTAYLLVALVGSGIEAQRLAADQPAIVLLVNACTTAAALYALIRYLQPVSGAPLNPLVSVALFRRGDLTSRELIGYAIGQTVGALAGVVLARLMFAMPAYSIATQARTGADQWLSEVVATFGLILVVLISGRHVPRHSAGIVAAHIGAGFWFTPTDFANPSLTLARAFTDTYSGIRWIDIPAFVGAQCVGAVAATAVCRSLQGPKKT
jgi:glycerol uptake facilitator-like aquaporin